MQNSLLVRKVISDQASFSKIFTELVRKLYRNEYKNLYAEKDIENVISRLHVKYTKPISLNLTNINEQINNSSQTVDYIVGQYVDENAASADEDLQKLKMIFRKAVTKKIMPSIPWSEYDELFSSAKQEIMEKKVKEESDKTLDDLSTGSTDDEMMEDDDLGY